MLVIGHRGAAGLAPENTLEAFQKGFEGGADILEFDVQLTRDNVPIVVHDSTLLRTHHKLSYVKWSSHESIREATAKGHQIATLEEVLDKFFGVILLNLELKGRGAGEVVAAFIRSRYIHTNDDWSNILFSSFKASELTAVRKVSRQANLSLLHDRNPFLFIAYHRRLRFTAVGFHRLYMNNLALEIARRAELFCYVYTVNRPKSAYLLAQRGLDAVVTDHPDTIGQYLKNASS